MNIDKQIEYMKHKVCFYEHFSAEKYELEISKAILSTLKEFKQIKHNELMRKDMVNNGKLPCDYVRFNKGGE